MLLVDAPRLRAAFRICGAALALAVIGAVLIGAPASSAAEEKSEPASGPTADGIVAKNVAARGGLEAWRKIQTMVWIGHLKSTREQQANMRFVLQQKRPNKTRFEIQLMNERTMRVFDGIDGWKSNRSSEGRPVIQPYTPEEVRFAHGEQAIDGPLIDFKARGSTVTLVGIDQLEGRKTYRLDVRLSSGENQFVWVDATTFLDVKVARVTFSANGQPLMAPIFYRKFRTFEGLQIPTSIEIGDPALGPTDRMEIETVALNAPMLDRLFAKPGVTGRPTMPVPGLAVRPHPALPAASSVVPGPASQ